MMMQAVTNHKICTGMSRMLKRCTYIASVVRSQVRAQCQNPPLVIALQKAARAARTIATVRAYIFASWLYHMR
jgi:hypothetical protein